MTNRLGFTRKQKFEHLYERRAHRVALLLAGLPFVRMVGLTGSLARKVARVDSDIDFFMVAAPGRLFTVRFCVTLLVQLLGIRRHGRKIAGRICLNRYQTADALEIIPHTRYHAEDLSQLVPLIDLDHIFEQFQSANQWMTKEFGFRFTGQLRRRSRSLRLTQVTRRAGEWLLGGRVGDWFEKQSKRFQLRYQVWNPATKDLRSNIVVTDSRLLFHPAKEGQDD